MILSLLTSYVNASNGGGVNAFERQVSLVLRGHEAHNSRDDVAHNLGLIPETERTEFAALVAVMTAGDAEADLDGVIEQFAEVAPAHRAAFAERVIAFHAAHPGEKIDRVINQLRRR